MAIEDLKPYQFKKGEAPGRPKGAKNKRTLMMEELVYKEIMRRGLVEKIVGTVDTRIDDDTIKTADAITFFKTFVAPYFMPNPEKTIDDSISEIETPEEAQNAVELLLERVKQITEKD